MIEAIFHYKTPAPLTPRGNKYFNILMGYHSICFVRCWLYQLGEEIVHLVNIRVSGRLTFTDVQYKLMVRLECKTSLFACNPYYTDFEIFSARRKINVCGEDQWCMLFFATESVTCRESLICSVNWLGFSENRQCKMELVSLGKGN